MPAPPYSAGTEQPSRPSSAICGRMLRVEAMLAIELADPRRHFARPPLPHRLLQQPVFLGQIEVDHDESFVIIVTLGSKSMTRARVAVDR